MTSDDKKQLLSGKRTRDVDVLGLFLCVVGAVGLFLSLREAFLYRILTAIGKETPLPPLYFVYNQLFLPLLTLLLLISGGGVLQRRGWARRLVFVLAVVGFSFFVILNIDVLVRVTVGQRQPPVAIPVQLYLFIYWFVGI